MFLFVVAFLFSEHVVYIQSLVEKIVNESCNYTKVFYFFFKYPLNYNSLDTLTGTQVIANTESYLFYRLPGSRIGFAIGSFGWVE